VVPGGTVERTTTVCRAGEPASALPTEVVPAVNADRSYPFVGQVQLRPRVATTLAQLAHPFLRDIDERHVVAGRQEALTRRRSHDTRPDDEDPRRLHGIAPSLLRTVEPVA
jgi:hypothetical protein